MTQLFDLAGPFGWHVTFETLNKLDFLLFIKIVFPAVDWDRAYEECKAAGEKKA